MPQLNSLEIEPGTGSVPLDSQAVHLPPLTARSRNLVRFARHLPIETMDESFAGDFAFRDARQHVGPVSYRSRCELLAGETDLVFSADGARLASAPVTRVLPAGEAITLSFAVRFAFNDETFSDWPADLWSDESLAQAVAATEHAYEAVGGIVEASPRHGDLVLKAAGTLRSLRYRDRDPQGQSVMTIHAGKTGCGATWFWDSGVTLPALGLVREREAGAGVLRLLTRGIGADGKPAVTYENQTYRDYGYQMPVLAWGAGHYLAQTGDADLLRELYDPLARYVRHWLDNFRTQWGLVTHPAGCSCLDDALRWHSGSPLSGRPGQPWYEQKWGQMSPTAFAAPDINAFLVLECRTLAAMAGQLGKIDDASAWRILADDLAAAINEWLIEPQTRTYQDRHIETGAFNGMVNLASFIPVYAGIAAPDIAEHLCRDYLLSPDHFLTDLPFPVIDRAHPTFRHGGFLHTPPANPDALAQHSYWRGRTWIHGDTWYLGALWQSGFRQEADELADRILTAVGRSEGINECYDSLTGFGNGHPEFMWSSAAVIMIACGFHTGDPVATFTNEPE